MATRFGRTSMSGTQWSILGGMPDGDIEALAFLVMMMAAKSANEDLRSVMDSVKAINEEKAKQRKELEARQSSAARLTCRALAVEQAGDALLDALETLSLTDVADKLDTLSEMGEMESLRLQMAMDRMSKMMATLSNLLKKQSDTAAAIVGNLK